MPTHPHITIIMTLVSRSTEGTCFEARLKDVTVTVSDAEMKLKSKLGLGLEKSSIQNSSKKHLMLERL